MRNKLFLITGLAALTILQGASSPPTDASAAFARLKTLVGEWQADTPAGKATLRYELTGGGTALIERESAESMPGMMTVYHLDGSRVILTHYCMAGNQPRMQASAFDAESEIQFRFLDATNLSTPGAGHMHNMRLRILDENHIEAAWEFYENGAPARTETFHYARVR